MNLSSKLKYIKSNSMQWVRANDCLSTSFQYSCCQQFLTRSKHKLYRLMKGDEYMMKLRCGTCLKTENHFDCTNCKSREVKPIPSTGLREFVRVLTG